MDANKLNQELRSLYEANWTNLLSIRESARGVSWPLLLKVQSEYLSAERRLLIVGKETKGWQGVGEIVTKDLIGWLMNGYDEFALGRNYTRSPFWQAAHEIHRRLNPSSPPQAFSWSNLIKVDQALRRPDPAIEQAVSEVGLLHGELSILRPHVVVFFTGPDYDERLQNTFPGIEYLEVSPLVQRLTHPGLPVLSYRTYHPNYLWQANKREAIDELVCDATKN